jgi:hypothetical protein
MHTKFHNPSGDMLTSIMGFMWQKREYSLHSLRQILKTALATVFDIIMAIMMEMDGNEVQYTVKYNADTLT